jgi:hypothetical protein
VTAARDALTVFVAGEERPGIIVYGLVNRGGRSTSILPERVWPGAGVVDESLLVGDSWEVAAWDIALRQWPEGDAWSQAIKNVLRAHIDAGCVVAWVGAEGVPFCDPPQLFDARCMSGGVLAWMTSEEFDCPLDPDQPLNPVDDEVLAWLRDRARGLADAP